MLITKQNAKQKFLDLIKQLRNCKKLKNWEANHRKYYSEKTLTKEIYFVDLIIGKKI